MYLWLNKNTYLLTYLLCAERLQFNAVFVFSKFKCFICEITAHCDVNLQSYHCVVF